MVVGFPRLEGDAKLMFILTSWLIGLIWMWSLLVFFYKTKDRDILNSRGWLIAWIFIGMIPFMNLMYAGVFTVMRFDRISASNHGRLKRFFEKTEKWFSSPVFPDRDDWRG